MNGVFISKVVSLLWREVVSSLLHGKTNQKQKRVISVRLFAESQYQDPCAFLPQDGLVAFWHALGVSEETEDKLQPEWRAGNMIPVAPAFPVLSWLIQMQIDNSTVNFDDLSELLREIAIGREKCTDTLGLTVFNELEKAATLALDQGKGISLSPFG